MADKVVTLKFHVLPHKHKTQLSFASGEQTKSLLFNPSSDSIISSYIKRIMIDRDPPGDTEIKVILNVDGVDYVLYSSTFVDQLIITDTMYWFKDEGLRLEFKRLEADLTPSVIFNTNLVEGLSDG